MGSTPRLEAGEEEEEVADIDPAIGGAGVGAVVEVGGSNPNAYGIDGDIKAESGLIDSIESTGPIGVTRRVSPSAPK